MVLVRISFTVTVSIDPNKGTLDPCTVPNFSHCDYEFFKRLHTTSFPSFFISEILSIFLFLPLYDRTCAGASAVLYWSVLFYSDQCYFILISAILYWSLLFYIDQCCFILISAVLHWSVLFYIDQCCFILISARMCFITISYLVLILPFNSNAFQSFLISLFDYITCNITFFVLVVSSRAEKEWNLCAHWSSRWL